MDSTVSGLAVQSASTTKYSLCKLKETSVLRSEDLQPDSVVVGAVPTSSGTIQSYVEGTTSGNADTSLL